MVEVRLAADLGYGVSWLVLVLVTAILTSTGFFVYTVMSTKFNHTLLRGKDSLKYKLHKYHAEKYWAISVAVILIWLWFLGLPWSPPVAFQDAVQSPQNIHTVRVTAGQWFWNIKDQGFQNVNGSTNGTNQSLPETGDKGSSDVNVVKIKAGETVKFVARSVDVNHGFAVLRSSHSMDSPLFQMQVVPGYDNVFYYTFKKAGTYTIRCLEYCGWNHPYMTSQFTIQAA